MKKQVHTSFTLTEVLGILLKCQIYSTNRYLEHLNKE